MGSPAEPTEESLVWAAGTYPAPRTGSFRFWFATRRWEWSPELYRMHGYAPGEVEPTTERLLAHKHPDDRDKVAEAIARSVELGEPFSSRHRFIDTHGVEHQVMVVADHILDQGCAVGTAGFYIDLADTLARAEHDALLEQLPEVIEARAAIEQAKGVLMRMYSSATSRHSSCWRGGPRKPTPSCAPWPNNCCTSCPRCRRPSPPRCRRSTTSCSPCTNASPTDHAPGLPQG